MRCGPVTNEVIHNRICAAVIVIHYECVVRRGQRIVDEYKRYFSAGEIPIGVARGECIAAPRLCCPYEVFVKRAVFFARGCEHDMVIMFLCFPECASMTGPKKRMAHIRSSAMLVHAEAHHAARFVAMPCKGVRLKMVFFCDLADTLLGFLAYERGIGKRPRGGCFDTPRQIGDIDQRDFICNAPSLCKKNKKHPCIYSTRCYNKTKVIICILLDRFHYSS